MLLLSRFTVHGHSMMPALLPGQTVFVSGIPYLFCTPKEGDIVLIQHPQTNVYLLKRIAHVNGATYTVMGDNSQDSKDSREFGKISRAAIRGKVLFSL